MVADGESAELAKRLIADTCGKQAIEPGQLTIHADRGSSMTSKPVAFLMADLGITKTHSRPHVSDDNPYSESQFRTLKYRPRVSGTLRIRSRMLVPFPRSSLPGTTNSTAIPDSVCSPGSGSLRSGDRRHRTASRGARCSLHRSSRTLRPQAATAASGAKGGLDQQTTAVRKQKSVNYASRCLKVLTRAASRTTM